MSKPFARPIVTTLLRILLVLVGLLVVSLGIFWFLRPLDVDFEALRTEVPHQELSHFADLDGLRIHYQECGAGTPLVLVHGFMSSTYDWKEVLTLVSNRFHVVAIDLKGFGFSTKPPGDYTLTAQADLVVRLLDHLKLDKAMVCGQSMGGNVVIRVALRHPERVMGLILVDSAGLKPVNGKGRGAAPGYARWPVIGPLVTALAVSSDAVIRSGLSKCYFDKSKVTTERVATCYRVLRTRNGLSAAMATQAQNSTDLSESLVGGLGQPTLVIWGSEDQLIPIETGKRFNGLIHGSRLVTFKQCGHVPQAELPRQFATEVLGFLNSTPH